MASWGRRFLALAVDWVASLLVAGAFFGTAVWGQGWQAWAPMGVFLVEASVLTALVGGSFGQLVLRVAVVRVDNKPLNFLQTVARTALICLVVPPLVFNRDNRWEAKYADAEEETQRKIDELVERLLKR